jgi:hypothetical protein
MITKASKCFKIQLCNRCGHSKSRHDKYDGHCVGEMNGMDCLYECDEFRLLGKHNKYESLCECSRCSCKAVIFCESWGCNCCAVS